jgi:hypothetical protein
MQDHASPEALEALRLKLEGPHEHTWRYFETVIHDEGHRCYHYHCVGRKCRAAGGIVMTTPRIQSHKWEER